jgi:2,3-bisphosphoglycerate-independent phosphoglycerate mutase
MAPVQLTRRPLLLMVLDGWGHRDETEANAIAGNAPFFKDCLGRYPHTLLTASGREVGLPLGLMGNSEVGHLNLGAGRVVYQDVSRIDKAIEDGAFRGNPALTGAMDLAAKQGKQLHLVGLVSDGGVHSSDHHLRHLLKLAAERGVPSERVLVHAITDGRDTPPRSAADYLAQLEQDIADAGVGRIASVVGRYFAMDRDKRWERVQKAYDCLVAGVGEQVSSAVEGARASYAKDVGDEFFEPMIVGEPGAGRIQDGDAVLCFNYRSDRMRELCECLTFEAFTGFERRVRVNPKVTTMTQYRADFPYPIAYPPMELKGILPEVISAAGLRQERIAETEKYAHVTFFFSGGNEAELPGESRTLVPSPKVATYDMQPEMSAYAVTEAILASLEKGETDVYIINFANADMVGHTGDLDAAAKAVAAVDECLSKIVPVVVAKGGVAAITADHGNAEQLWDPIHNQPHTAHTINPVPIVFCGASLDGIKLREMGILADVAPTILELGGLQKSPEMDGVSLIE